MNSFDKATAVVNMAQIPGAITAAVQSSQQLLVSVNRVYGLWVAVKTGLENDAEAMAEAATDFNIKSAEGWLAAKPNIEQALDILAGGVGLTRNELLTQLQDNN